MHDERIWLVGSNRVQEDLCELLMGVGLHAERVPEVGSSWKERPTVLLGSADELAEFRGHAPDALAIGWLEPDDEQPEGLDAAVRGPIHPQAFRILLDALRYQGADRRWAERVALGVGIRLWSRGPGRATLLDLSVAGCRILSHGPMQVGRRVVLWLPGTRAAAWPRRVVGRVVRSLPAELCDADAYAVSLSFTKVSMRSSERLLALLEEHRGARLASLAALRIRQSDPNSLGPETAESAERRHQRRQVYDRRVIAKRDQGPSVLMGRDLSVGGIKVAPSEQLALGTELQIAVHGKPGTTPLVLDASVTRDDGEDGLVLEFANLDERRQEYLEKLVGELDAEKAPESQD